MASPGWKPLAKPKSQIFTCGGFDVSSSVLSSFKSLQTHD